MGNLVMPKNSAEISEMNAVLKVYYDTNDWLDNSIFIEKMKLLLGEPFQEPQAYTKKTQIPSYFGFTTWEDLSNPQSRRKITDSGKRFYEAIKTSDTKSIYEELMLSLENLTFGRNVCGCSSDSDIEPPQIFIKSVLALNYLTRQEYGYLLWQLDEEKGSLFDLITTIAVNRRKNIFNYASIPPKFGDAKPITALINWNFLVKNGKIGSQDKIFINEDVLNNYIDRLLILKNYNNDVKKFVPQTEDYDDIEGEEGMNKIFYGAPGTGKSFKIDKIIESLDSNYFERITFHPEYDNATFVGGYKPISEENEKGEEIIKYKFIPQAFTNIYERAWKDKNHQYYLVIEEINRGNCAEIFGDIFQLLDRTSKYTVSPSKELKAHLVKVFENENHPGIKNGLKLPTNLTIYATMNTSDQSLFPMDSAFKRRWDWQYVPICYELIDEFSNPNESSNFEIDIEDGFKYSWIKFIKKVNLEYIKENPSLGMDKCIGNYFIKPNIGNTITLKPFINKVVFYLWNDVFKDEKNEVFEDKSSYEDFFPIVSKGKEKIKELFVRIGLEPIKKGYFSLDSDSQSSQAAEDQAQYGNDVQ
jgi:hypothetical protein